MKSKIISMCRYTGDILFPTYINLLLMNLITQVSDIMFQDIYTINRIFIQDIYYNIISVSDIMFQDIYTIQ